MGIEIERKFLVRGDAWRGLARGTRYRQGYLSLDKERVVRVRRAGDLGFITVKGAARGAVKSEFEYEIPVSDADEMLDSLCKRPLVEKNRYRIDACGFLWEVDEFLCENSGLIVAEIELQTEEQAFENPPWIGLEVTDDPRYFNSNLCVNPFSGW